MDALERIKHDEAQTTLVAFASLTREVDLEGFIAAIERGEIVESAISPVLYYMAGHKVKGVQRLAEAALQFQAEVKRQEGEDDG